MEPAQTGRRISSETHTAGTPGLSVLRPGARQQEPQPGLALSRSWRDPCSQLRRSQCSIPAAADVGTALPQAVKLIADIFASLLDGTKNRNIGEGGLFWRETEAL